MTTRIWNMPGRASARQDAAGVGACLWRNVHCVIAATILISAPAHSAAAYAEYIHTVRAGDTLIGIGQRLLKRPGDWVQVQRLNAVADPYRLPIGIALRIPVSLMRAEVAPARIANATGEVRDAQGPVAFGAAISERTQLETGADGYATVELADGSTLTLQPRSRLRIEALKRYRNTDAYDARFRLDSGRVETRSAGQARGAGRQELRTPSAVIGVRGTRFRVSAEERGPSRAEVTEGVVSAARAATPGTAAPVREGFGIVVEQDKPLARPVALLDAPDLTATPALQERVALRFGFPAVTGARSYRGQIASDQEFRAVLAEGVFASPEAKFAAPPDGDYWLRIRGIDVQGLEGRDAAKAFRLKARPEPPFPSQPTNGGKWRGDSVEFRWAAAEEAASYLFQLAADESFGALVHEAAAVTQTGLTSPGKLAPGNYAWRTASVRADGDRGPWGDVQRFTLRPAPADPDPPRIEDRQLTFTWPAEPGQSFELQLARDPRFAEAVTTLKLDVPAASLERPEPGTYYMRVRATDPDGFVGPYTATQSFEVPAPPPWWLLLFVLPLL